MIPIILAQTSSPSDHEFVIWATIAALVIGFSWVIVQIIQSFRRSPPIDAEFATKRELHELRKDFMESLGELEKKFDHNAEKIDRDLEQNNLHAETRASKMHERIDKILQGVSMIQGQYEEHIRKDSKV